VRSIVIVLAFIGAAALAYRLLRSLAGLAVSLAEIAAASGLSEQSARRGDLTAMAERRQAESAARRARLQQGLLALFWFLCLAIPPFTPWTPAFYAAASPLWFFPTRSIRPGQIARK
jgi:hypothetical protein